MDADPCAVIKQLVAADDHEAVREHFGCFSPSFIAGLAGECLAEKTVRMLIKEEMLVSETHCCRKTCNVSAQEVLVKALVKTRRGAELLAETASGMDGEDADKCQRCGNYRPHLNHFDWFGDALLEAMMAGDVEYMQYLKVYFFDDIELVTEIVTYRPEDFVKAWTTCPRATADWLTQNTYLTNVHLHADDEWGNLLTEDSVKFDDAFTNENGYLCTTGLGALLVKRTRALPYQALSDAGTAVSALSYAYEDHPDYAQMMFFIGAAATLSLDVLVQAVIQFCLRKKKKVRRTKMTIVNGIQRAVTEQSVVAKHRFEWSWLVDALQCLEPESVDTVPEVITLRKALGVPTTAGPELELAKAAMRAELIKLQTCSSLNHVVRYMSPETWQRTRTVLLVRNHFRANPLSYPLPLLPVEIWDLIVIFLGFAERPLIFV